MIRDRLTYHRPADLGEASALLLAHAHEVAVLGGGTQLLPRMGHGQIRARHVVDIIELGLDGISMLDDDRLLVEARVTYTDVLESVLVRQFAPLLHLVSEGITGGRQLLQQATLVGSLCQNYPGTDMPGALAALDARVHVHGRDGERRVAWADFLMPGERVALSAGELVTAVDVGPAEAVGYCKLKTSVGSWPVATASAVRSKDGQLSVTLGAVNETPIRFQPDADKHLAAQISALLPHAWADVLAPARYRQRVAPVAARRALADLTARSTR